MTDHDIIYIQCQILIVMYKRHLDANVAFFSYVFVELPSIFPVPCLSILTVTSSNQISVVTREDNSVVSSCISDVFDEPQLSQCGLFIYTNSNQ